jgi:DNA-binding transcriptional MerR regulator
MRIGEFSKKYNITHDTVRHYIDMGLLIPRKDGHHLPE